MFIKQQFIQKVNVYGGMMEQMSIKEIEQQTFMSKIGVTGTYLVSFGYSLASVYETFVNEPGSAVAYAFCAGVAFFASAILGSRIDEMNNSIEKLRKGSLEARL